MAFDTPTARYALNLILNADDCLLLLKRAANASIGAGQWGLPAGKIEVGETPDQAATREMLEEIGSEHTVRQTQYVGPLRDSFYGGQFEIHLFQHQWLGGEVSLNHEHSDFAWVGKTQIRNYDVMLGIEEDIAILGFWPLEYLNQSRLPERFKHSQKT